MVRTIESAMTPFPYSIEAGAPASSAKTMMRQFGIRHLPVREGERLLGVVCARDLECAERFGGISLDPGTALTVRDLCLPGRFSVVPASEPLETVLRHMAEQHLEVVLVLRDGRLAGIFTVTDACRQYAHCLQSR